MRITKKTHDGYEIYLDGTENPNFQQILEGWLDALEFHELKSHDYDERDEPGVWNLGLRGEWPGVTRKIQKLHKIIWKGKDVLFEGGQEIMMDLMGAIGLMLHEQKKIKDKYSAGWRDNHNNKPTFGPGPKDSSWLATLQQIGDTRLAGSPMEMKHRTSPIGRVVWHGPSKVIQDGDIITEQHPSDCPGCSQCAEPQRTASGNQPIQHPEDRDCE